MKTIPPTDAVTIPPPDDSNLRGSYNLFVVGLQHGQYEYVKEQIKPDVMLRVIKETSNPYDLNALRLAFNEHPVGYVRKEKAALIAALEKASGRELELKCRILKHYPEETTTIYNRLLVNLKYFPKEL